LRIKTVASDAYQKLLRLLNLNDKSDIEKNICDRALGRFKNSCLDRRVFRPEPISRKGLLELCIDRLVQPAERLSETVVLLTLVVITLSTQVFLSLESLLSVCRDIGSLFVRSVYRGLERNRAPFKH
jgi:hypothetical protein